MKPISPSPSTPSNASACNQSEQPQLESSSFRHPEIEELTQSPNEIRSISALSDLYGHGETRQPPLGRENSRLSNIFRRLNSRSQSSITIPPSLNDWVTANQNTANQNTENKAKAATAISKTLPGSNRKKPKTELDLSNKNLTDLPDSLRSSYAESINLSNNALAGIPDALTDVIHLTELDLSHNQIEEIPGEFSKLVSLNTLDLSSNQLKIIPEAINHLASLQTLNLNNNQIKEISSGLSGLIDLNTLSVTNNDLRALAPEIGTMPNLKKIDLSHNKNLKSIPPEWAQLFFGVLKELHLKNTGLQALPPLDRHPTGLETLNLEDNPDMKVLPVRMGPAMQNKDLYKITTTKKGNEINIYTRGSCLVPGMASDGRLQIKHGRRTIPAGKNLPPSIVDKIEEDNDNLSIQNNYAEVPANEAPPQLALDQAGLFKKWETIKQKLGAGPNDLMTLKQGVNRQNLVTIFAHTYGQLQNLQGKDLNIKEYDLALNAATARHLDLPLTEELAMVGALHPLTQQEVNEALQAVSHLEKLNEEQIRLAASQLESIARQEGAFLALFDNELSNQANEIKNFYTTVTADQIKQVFELAKGSFRQDLINKISQIFTRVQQGSIYAYPLDGIETSLVFQVHLAERLNLPGKIGQVKLPPRMEKLITPEEVQMIGDLVLALEEIDGGALLKNYLETKPFWSEYVNELAEKLIVADKITIDEEVKQIKDNKGWTPEYKKLGLALFRQDKFNLVSHFEVFNKEEEQAIDNPKLIALNYQIQLANQLELPGVLQDFPKEVASVICWRIPAEKLERVSNAVLEYEQLKDGQLLNDFLQTQDFWREHQITRSEMFRNQEALYLTMDILKKALEKIGLKVHRHLYF